MKFARGAFGGNKKADQLIKPVIFCAIWLINVILCARGPLKSGCTPSSLGKS